MYAKLAAHLISILLCLAAFVGKYPRQKQNIYSARLINCSFQSFDLIFLTVFFF